MKTLSIFLIAVLLFVGMALPVAAASNDDGGSLWDALSSIFSFFGDLIGGVIDAIFKIVDLLLDGLKYLFIPRQNYFNELVERLNSKLSEKFGGIMAAANYLSQRFGNMSAYKDIEKRFVLTFPKNSIFPGYSVNLLDGTSSFMQFVRSAFSGAVVIATYAFCKRKLVEQLES